MVEKAKRMMQQESGWQNPFGDGRAGESILEHLTAG
jgi:UDP-N-acetylglucosamine 2-epimerase